MRRHLAGLALLLLLPALAGCPSGGEANPNEIVIGHYASMTGAQATFGNSTENGIRLAVEEINAAGGINGKKIATITYDDRGDVREAGSAVTRLITRDNVVAVLGEVASSLSLAGAPVCQEHGVPMITPSSTNPRVTTVGDMIFRVCFIDDFQGSVCAKFAHDPKGLAAKKVAILYDQGSAYSAGLAQEFRRPFTELGGTITTEVVYSEGDQDFTAQLTTIRGSEPDAVFVPGYYTDVANIAVQARRLGIKVPLLGADGWDSKRLAEIGGDAINGCYYSNHYSPQDPRPQVQEFISKYKAAHGGEVPDGLAALGYDAAMLLAEAMKRAQSLDGKDLAAAIAETTDFQGVTGTISINDKRDAVKSAVILKMVNGQPTFVTQIEPGS